MQICNRHITHFDLDAFFVSVELLQNPKLKGKPVLVGGNSGRGVVAACSYEARKFGIHSAMPMATALRLCKYATVVKGDFEAYSKYSRLVTDVIKDNVPLYEKASIDEFYIDLTGMDRFFGCMKYSQELKSRITKETGLPISFALASNKIVSKVATNEVKPAGQIEIAYGNEKNFLAPLSVMKMPGVGKETGYKLLKMGVETIKTLSEIPVDLLQNLLGKFGTEVWKRANGIDESPVVPYVEQKSISTENTFETDTIDVRFLHAELSRMTEKIAFELRSQNKLTGCVTVKIKYSDFQTYTKQKSISYSNSDAELLKVARDLFDNLYQKRQLIRLIGVRFTDLIPGCRQIDLFADTQRDIALYQAIDSVKKRYGQGLLLRGSSI